MAATKSVQDLFVNLLKDVYFAEKDSQGLAEDGQEGRFGRTPASFRTSFQGDRRPGRAPRAGVRLMWPEAFGQDLCPAIEGILEEGEEDMKEAKEPKVLDAGMIADAQAVEHYEIARYGTLIAWANQLGMPDAARLFQQNIDQEYNADMLLTDLAEGRLNRQAA